MSRRKKKNSLCCVLQCKFYCNEEISFHRFPRVPVKRESWEVALRMREPASDKMSVCSRHFTPLDYFPRGPATKKRWLYPHAVPSQNLPLRPHDKVLTPFRKSLIEARMKRAEVRAIQKEKNGTECERPKVLPKTDITKEYLGEKLPSKPIKIMWPQLTQVNLMDDRPDDMDVEGRSLSDMLAEGTLDKACQVRKKFVRS